MGTLNGLSARSLQYFVIAKKWNSDIEFYKFEANFFRKLLDECFFVAASAGERHQIVGINNELMKLEVDKNQFESSLGQQIKRLEMMLEDVIPEDINQVECKQIELELQVAGLFADFRELKKVIFKLVPNTLFQNISKKPFLSLN